MRVVARTALNSVSYNARHPHEAFAFVRSPERSGVTAGHFGVAVRHAQLGQRLVKHAVHGQRAFILGADDEPECR